MRNPAKYDRCVGAVERRGAPVNPYAVCAAAGLRGLGVDIDEPPPRIVRGSSYFDDALALPLWSGSAAQQSLANYTALQTLTAPRLAAPAASGQDWAAMLDEYKWPIAGVALLAVVMLKGRR